MMDDGSINKKFDVDICAKKAVRIAFNNEPKSFVYNETTKDFDRKKPFMKNGLKNNIIWDYEILEEFIRIYNIVPTWINNYYNWGTWLKDEGKWSGAVGKVC